LQIRRQALSDASELQRIARARVEAGRSPPSEQMLANALVGSAQAGVLEARGRLFVALTELRALTGINPDALVVVGGELAAAGPRTPARPAGVGPDVAASRAAARTSANAAELERAAGRPFLSLGSSLTREGTGDYIVLGRMEVPLPFVNPASFLAARQDAEARIAQARAQQISARIEREVRLATEERAHAGELRDALDHGVVAQARAALDQARLEYQAGKGELAAVLAARRELLVTLERFAEAAADVRRADLRLERLLGAPPDAGSAAAGRPRRSDGR
jgi:outer membrane protein TolC